MQGSLASELSTKDLMRTARHRSTSPVLRHHPTSPSSPSSIASTSSRFERDRDSFLTTSRRAYTSPDTKRRAEDHDRALQKAQMQKFGALVSSSLNRLTVNQGVVDSTYKSLSSLRHTRKSWESLQSRPTSQPRLGSSPGAYNTSTDHSCMHIDI